jgi:excisionase family DNA binding protein
LGHQQREGALMSTNEFPAARRLLRLHEVALRVGFSRSWIYQAQKEGRLPASKKVGRSARWDSDAIDAWVASQAAD